MAKHKPKRGTYRVKGNTGQPMDFATRARAKNVARQIEGGTVRKNRGDGTGCIPVVLAVMATATAAGTTAVSYLL